MSKNEVIMAINRWASHSRWCVDLSSTRQFEPYSIFLLLLFVCFSLQLKSTEEHITQFLIYFFFLNIYVSPLLYIYISQLRKEDPEITSPNTRQCWNVLNVLNEMSQPTQTNSILEYRRCQILMDKTIDIAIDCWWWLY